MQKYDYRLKLSKLDFHSDINLFKEFLLSIYKGENCG